MTSHKICDFVIVGLDPAGPVFARRPRKARLDSTDARFVDVIHTSFNYLVGIMGRCGHVDFYVNGGGKQPGCWPKRELISAFLWVLHVVLLKFLIGLFLRRSVKGSSAWLQHS